MSDFDNTPVTEADLADFDDVYVDSEVSDDQFEPVPDGKYQVLVDRVELVRTSKGDPMLKWTLRVTGPTHEGRLLWRNNVMATDENIRWLKKDLFACDVRLARLSELPASLERLLDIRLEVTKKSRGEYESVYINRRVRTAGEDGGGKPDGSGSNTAGRSAAKAHEELGKF